MMFCKIKLENLAVALPTRDNFRSREQKCSFQVMWYYSVARRVYLFTSLDEVMLHVFVT